MGYNLEMAREFIDYAADWSRQLTPAAAAVEDHIFTDPDRPEREIKAFRVQFASGFKVLALPSVPRALRGMQGLVILDEAAFHDDLEALLKAAFALLIWGGRVVVISTHDGDQNPFNLLVQDIRAGRKPYRLLRCTFDDALAQGLYRRICLVKGDAWSPEAEARWRAEIIAQYGDAADEELHVIPSPTSGTALPAPLIEARMEPGIPVLRWACKAEFVHWAEHLRVAEARDWCDANIAPVLLAHDQTLPHAIGMDFGRSVDLSVIWVFAIRKDLVRHTPLVIELSNVPFEQQRQVLFYLMDRLPRLRAGKIDATGNGAYLGEVAMQRYGARIEPLKLSEPWYRDNMPPMKAAFEDAMLTIPRDRDIMDDLRALKLVRGVIRVPERQAGDTRHGDAAIALALAYAASRAEPEEYGYRAAGQRPSGEGRDRPQDDRERPMPRRELRGALT
jgi:phage FluMu gp28-like protein